MKPGQFSLRQLFWTTFVCAIVFAVAAPFVRRMSPRNAIWYGAMLSACAISFLANRIWLAKRLQQIEAAAGPKLLRAIEPRRWHAIGLIPCVVFFTLLWALAIPSRPQVSFNDLIPALFYGFLASNLYSCRRLDFCERGIIVGDQLFAWSQIRSFSWSIVREPPTLVLTFPRPASTAGHPRMSATIYEKVPMARREAIDALLADHDVPRAANPIGGPHRRTSGVGW